ncbi:MAG: hypothetical protein ACRELV_10600 [Longimicrobiales bacterium]
MALLATLNAEARTELREAIRTRAGADAVFMDEERGVIWIVCKAAIQFADARASAALALEAGGVDPVEVKVRCVAESSEHTARRVRLLDVEREPLDDGHIRVRATLEWGDQAYAGEATGERSTSIELRTAALAVLAAIHTIVGESLDLRLVGVKHVRAFDADLVVVSIYRGGDPPQRLVGTVLQTQTPTEAAVMAVLNALNRLLGNYLDRPVG